MRVAKANAGVANTKIQYHMLAFLVIQHDTHNDIALMGELECIADQIVQHLMDPQRITTQGGRDIVVHHRHQV